MQDVKVQYRRLSEIVSGRGALDVNGFNVPAEYESTLKANPFRKGKDVPFVKLGLVDGRFGGQEYVFPLNMMIDGKRVLSGSGSCTHVQEWARKSGIGLEFAILHKDHRDGEFNVTDGSGLSQMALRLQRLLGNSVFEYPRLILPLKSRSILETKLKGVLLKGAIIFVDSCIWAYSHLVRMLAHLKANGIRVIKVDPTNEQQLAILDDMTAQGTFRFSELHNVEWFKWVLTNSFSKYGPAKAYILYRGDAAVGFFMTKKRFHEQASHRGFKNVWLGSVIEWGCVPGCEKKLLWSIIKWVLKARKELDAVEFPVCEHFAQRFLRRLGWRQVGNANFCYNIRPNSGFVAPEGMDNPANWRLRPGMGDVALN